MVSVLGIIIRQVVTFLIILAEEVIDVTKLSMQGVLVVLLLKVVVASSID